MLTVQRSFLRNSFRLHVQNNTTLAFLDLNTDFIITAPSRAKMAFNISLEVYLSLITVVIMCIPGLAFLIRICWNRTTKNKQESKATPIHERQDRPVLASGDAIFSPRATPRYPVRAQERQFVASQEQSSLPMTNTDCIELVGDECNVILGTMGR